MKEAVSNILSSPFLPPMQGISGSEGESSCPIVAIGASAGGLEALKRLLPDLPADKGLAFVIIQHLDPSHESALPQILARTTKMTVTQAQDGMAVEPNRVYVVPPNVDMSLEGSVLRFKPRRETGAGYLPIDHFFRSLARSHGNRAVGVILSGTGSDGALGLAEIKGRGGITFVQDPATAKFSGMPRSAISTNAVDFVLSAECIGQELTRVAGNPYVASSPQNPAEAETSEPSIDPERLERIFTLLRRSTGVDFTHYKHNTIFRRVARRVALKKMRGFEEYVASLNGDPEELKALYHELLIKVTGFFRDPETFEALKSNVIPRILERSQKGPIRVWVPGCASGEEAYSIAMCFLECLGDQAAERPLRIFATDIDELILHKARVGSYIENIALDVSPERLRRFFTKTGHQYRINKSIREMCTFAKHDLCQDPPFSNLDLISCKNLLIYLGPSLQKKVFPLFHYALKPGGFLMLGKAETIGGFSEIFAVEDNKHKIYSKKSVMKPVPVDFASYGLPNETTETIARGTPFMEESLRKEIDVFKEADRVLLNQYAPAGVLIDEQFHILQFRGDTSPYLVPSPGKASFHLLNMAREGLLSALTDGIETARKTGVSCTYENVRFKRDGAVLNVTLKVVPLERSPISAQHFIVIFENRSPSSEGGTWKTGARGFFGRVAAYFSRSRFISTAQGKLDDGDLKSELQATKRHLQSIIENQDSTNEELKSSNEEILSSNEELQSTNEELETSKEEMQSTNEELETVNEELQNRNRELSQANDDLNNLYSSSNLPLLMIGRDLRVRRFTQAAVRSLGLLPSDMGRPVSEVKLGVFLPELESEILSVIEKNAVIEREVQDRRGGWYSLRILPFKTAENEIEGAIVLFIDIGSLKDLKKLTDSLNDLKLARNYSEGIVQTVREPLVILDAGLRVIQANPSFYETFRVSKKETEGQSLFTLGNNQWNIPSLRLFLEKILHSDVELHRFEVDHDFPHIGPKTMLLNARRIVLDGAGTETILLAIDDVTEFKLNAEKMRVILKEKEILLKEVHHRVKNNLQIISSLLKMKPDTIVDPMALQFIKESQDRIQAIALVHEKLYASIDLSEIDMGAYIRGLVEQLLLSYPGCDKIGFKTRASGILMGADLAFPCALILNELISNVCKHAFPGGRCGRVLVELKAENEREFTLLIRDDGVGMPADVNFSDGNSFGLHLVAQLVEQLEGRLDLERGAVGTTFRIRFPSPTVRGGEKTPSVKNERS